MTDTGSQMAEAYKEYGDWLATLSDEARDLSHTLLTEFYHKAGKEVRQERAAVVAWLRAIVESEFDWRHGTMGDSIIAFHLKTKAQQIECGEHLKDKSPSPDSPDCRDAGTDPGPSPGTGEQS